MNNPDIKLATSRGVSPDYGSGNGSGRDNLLERVASLEMEIKHLATKTWILACVLFVTFSVVSTLGWLVFGICRGDLQQ